MAYSQTEYNKVNITDKAMKYLKSKSYFMQHILPSRCLVFGVISICIMALTSTYN